MSFETAYRQLTPAEKSFADDYVEALERAAVRAGERMAVLLERSPLDTSERALAFLSRPLVRAAIAERVRDLTEQMDLSAHRAVKELSNIAFSSIGHYMEVDDFGQPHFDMTKCTPEQLSAISSIEIEDNPRGARKFKFKLHDKNIALTNFLRLMGLFDGDNNPWRDKTARTVQVQALPVGASMEDAYSRVING